MKIKTGLDKALEYVSLPQYESSEPEHRPRKSEEPTDTTATSILQAPVKTSPKAVVESEMEKRNPYAAVFTWLRTKPNAVDKIFRVSVEDRFGKAAHTDDGIRDILEPFDIEIWDWRKIDISSDTIFDAAPNTRELRLYWSGNKAVIRSWASEHGLCKLAKVSVYNTAV